MVKNINLYLIFINSKYSNDNDGNDNYKDIALLSIPAKKIIIKTTTFTTINITMTSKLRRQLIDNYIIQIPFTNNIIIIIMRNSDFCNIMDETIIMTLTMTLILMRILSMTCNSINGACNDSNILKIIMR